MATAMENLKTLVAACPAFQTWVDADDATEAAAHVYLVALSAPVAARPFAMAREKEPADHRRPSIAGGSHQHFAEAGTLELLFEDAVAAGDADDHEDAELAFMAHVNAVVADMMALAGSGAYLIVRGITIVNGPARVHPDARQSDGDYYQVLLDVAWGVEP